MKLKAIGKLTSTDLKTDFISSVIAQVHGNGNEGAVKITQKRGNFSNVL